eukprot:CAMPEP_0197710276 /NCGR_PEP_ID=MMETSP1338-20131121/128876_1 /TAXON_ID=43686 ORGANISM="Pelagodinium beii, Strain RCC1491" /NCGR_SAMPLE_ID=MMETSP1338 /ASSEMBLY_ACC=CAM_ASM_000754 /LENGTH=58 /DNA_ID=CAMNT_0043294209 /DNA_START=869 /DNA_END=1043 /DNA_ORIENTATION=+
MAAGGIAPDSVQAVRKASSAATFSASIIFFAPGVGPKACTAWTMFACTSAELPSVPAT